MPLVQIYLAWRVTCSYTFNNYNETENQSDESSVAQDRDHLYRRYDVDAEISSTAGTFYEEQLQHQWFLWATALFFGVVSNSSYKHIAQTFHEAKVIADEAKYGMDESKVAEDEAVL